MRNRFSSGCLAFLFLTLVLPVGCESKSSDSSAASPECGAPSADIADIDSVNCETEPLPQLDDAPAPSSTNKKKRSETKDAYEEGYTNGYYTGQDDCMNGHCREYNYGNSSAYKGKDEERYKKGYEAGYEEGYEEGYSAREPQYDGEDDAW